MHSGKRIEVLSDSQPEPSLVHWNPKHSQPVLAASGYARCKQIYHMSHIFFVIPVAADVNLVWPQVPVMVQLINMVGSDDERSDSLVASAAGLLG